MKEIIEAKIKELVKAVDPKGGNAFDFLVLQQIDALTRLLSIINEAGRAGN